MTRSSCKEEQHNRRASAGAGVTASVPKHERPRMSANKGSCAEHVKLEKHSHASRGCPLVRAVAWNQPHREPHHGMVPAQRRTSARYHSIAGGL